MSNTDMPTMPKTQRRFFPKVDPKYRLLPPVDPETHAGLRANIALNGIVQPIVCDEREDPAKNLTLIRDFRFASSKDGEESHCRVRGVG